jgi:hypothetical protein
MANLTRRELLKLGLTGAGSLAVVRPNWLLAAPASIEKKDAHFYLQLIVQGGWDNSYLFDARPLAMTRAGKIQNYLGEEPTPWIGANGGSCLSTSVSASLLPFRNDLTVINGVVMTPTFIGHDQNMNQLFTGNEFGGDSFVPYLNNADTGMKPASLDAITSGSLFAHLENSASSVPLDPQSGGKLRSLLAALPPATPNNELTNFIRSRYLANSSSRGRFAQGTTLMLNGLEHTPNLQKILSEIRPSAPTMSPDLQFCELLADCFRLQIARSAVWVLSTQPQDIDVHGANQAKQHPATLKVLTNRIASVLRFLRETAFDSQQSLFDVTTIMITSEFARSMRTPGAPIDNTGTDHNNLNNTVLIAGKGIRGGQVFGASDFQAADETLSPAHLELDRSAVKIMGRPFDFKTRAPRTDAPEKFQISDYLTIGSVVNTIYKNFGSPETRYHRLGRNQPVAPLLQGLLKN